MTLCIKLDVTHDEPDLKHSRLLLWQHSRSWNTYGSSSLGTQRLSGVSYPQRPNDVRAVVAISILVLHIKTHCHRLDHVVRILDVQL